MSEAVVTWIVQGTLVLLVLSSTLAWSIFVLKLIQVQRLKRDNKRFLAVLRSVDVLPARKDLLTATGPIARLALAGLDAWHVDEPSVSGDVALRRDVLERSLQQQTRRERRVLERGITVLASIGTTAPFVGLFGTVFGIINALSGISRTGSASLDVVAGPIGEALIATGVGIAVAVPAVLAYNFFARSVKTLLADLDDYASSFVNAALRASLGATPVSAVLGAHATRAEASAHGSNADHRSIGTAGVSAIGQEAGV